MVEIEEIPPPERSDEFWEIQFCYLVEDGMIATEDEKRYFQSPEYRSTLDGYAYRTPDTLHRIYFVIDGVRVGASQYCTYKSEDGKCFILDFWVFPDFRGKGLGHECFQALLESTQKDGARYYALNCGKEDSRRFWLSNGFEESGTDEHGSALMIKRGS